MLQPYDYQIRVLEALQAGENVILRVPTGGGKTLASLLPFFQERAFPQGHLPEKALYVTPMRVLATQFVETAWDLYTTKLEPAHFQELQATYQRFGRELISIQTGESADDPQFESMITACTIDQLLSSAAGIPYGLDGRKANLNVGAVCGSYLILDEPHLYPLSQDGKSYKGAFTTCLELLRLLKGLTRFVFMSATLSNTLVQRLSEMLDATVIELSEAELAALSTQRSRTFTRATTALSAQQVLQQHDRCSLVVCNTVQHAQKMYLDLWEVLAQEPRALDLHLLHSRFTDEDRQGQGKHLSQLLGKDQWKDGVYQGARDIIVVATQVVEVGLDISVQTLHTELAPANSLIQRAGRCARFERQSGRVIIYHPANEEGKPISTRPYSPELCQATWEALAEFEGQQMSFREEQALIDEVHSASDLTLLQRYEEHRHELQTALTEGLCTGDRGAMTDLIRDITQVQLVINNDPEAEMQKRPWRWQSFSIHPSALTGKHWQDLLNRQQACDLEWACKQAQMLKQEQQTDEDDHRILITYEWPPITAPGEVPGALLIAMPQQLVTYDQQLGLVFLDGRLKLSPAWQERLETQRYQSPLLPQKNGRRQSDETQTQAQSYKQHIGGLADAYYFGIEKHMRYVMRRLEQAMKLEPGTIDRAIQLAIFAHDLGKLDERWQRWARAWQRLLHEKGRWSTPYKEPPPTHFFAKTNYDYQSQEQRDWQKELWPLKRPKHACESVMIARSMIFASLGVADKSHSNYAVARAVCHAIAHHHTPTAHEYGKTRLQEKAKGAIQEAFSVVCRDKSWNYKLDKLKLAFEEGDLAPTNALSPMMTRPNLASGQAQRYETWLAFLIVRALRLADQRADIYRQK